MQLSNLSDPALSITKTRENTGKKKINFKKIER